MRLRRADPGGRGVVCVDGFVELVQLLESCPLRVHATRSRNPADECPYTCSGRLRAPEPREDERLVVQRVRIRRLVGSGPIVGDERLLELTELGERVPRLYAAICRTGCAATPGVRLDRVSWRPSPSSPRRGCSHHRVLVAEPGPRSYENEGVRDSRASQCASREGTPLPASQVRLAGRAEIARPGRAAGRIRVEAI